MERKLPTRSLPPEPMEATESPEAEASLLEFADQQIAKMSDKARVLNTAHEVGFYELQQAGANYQQVWLGLTSISLLAKLEYDKIKEDWEEWYSDKYIKVRDELNPRTLSQSKWYGAKEIEMQVRTQYKVDFKKRQYDLSMAEHKVNFVRRLMEGWIAHNYTLSTMSRNAQAEVMGSEVEDSL